jgi:hypothetical protein
MPNDALASSRMAHRSDSLHVYLADELRTEWRAAHVLKVAQRFKCCCINCARASAPKSEVLLSTALIPFALIETTSVAVARQGFGRYSRNPYNWESVIGRRTGQANGHP